MPFLVKLLEKLLQKADGKTLRYLVANNISLTRWGIKKYPYIVSLAKIFKKKISEEAKLVTKSNILKIIKKNRPELLQYMTDVWLEREIQIIKKEFYKRT